MSSALQALALRIDGSRLLMRTTLLRWGCAVGCMLLAGLAAALSETAA